MSRRAGRFAAIALVFGFAAAQAPASIGPNLRIYDPTGRATPSLTMSDVVRSSAKASREPDSQGTLYFRFTRNGARKFRLLTRALARLGAREHRFERLVFSVDGRVYGRPVIDYHAFPDGLSGDQGVEIALSFTTARRLANVIRAG